MMPTKEIFMCIRKIQNISSVHFGAKIPCFTFNTRKRA